MRIAFRTRNTRRLCENQAFAEKQLGISVAALLRARLADIVAASSIGDLIVSAPEKMEDGVILMRLGPDAYLRLKANHNPAPMLPNGELDWFKVRRLQVIKVEVRDGY